MSIEKITVPILTDQLNPIIKEYNETIRAGKPGKDSAGKEITNQTKWIYFTQDEIEKLIDFLNTDKECKDLPKTEKGVKIYLGVYNEEIAKKYYPKDYEKYVGRITAALLTAKGEKEGTIEDILLESNADGELTYSADIKQRKPPIENVGTVCPPKCG